MKIDYLGATLIAAGVSTLLIWVSFVDSSFGWVSWQTAAMVASAVALLGSAVRVESRREIRGQLLSRQGNPYPCLRAMADEVKADIVVVGASAQRGHRLAGSIGTRLVRLGRWPITIVP